MIFGLAAPPEPSSAGASPYTVEGDPIVALIAQLNRFAGKTVTLPYPCKGSIRFLSAPFPLTAPITNEAGGVAWTAAQIMWQRLICAEWVGGKAPSAFTMLKNASEANQEAAWLQSNLADVTAQIAQFADHMGLEPAAVGITERDLRVVPSKFPTGALILVGLLAVGAIVVTRRMK